MALQMQIRRDDRATLDTKSGAQGEIGFDTDAKTLRAFDGVKLGGYPLARNIGVNVQEYGAKPEHESSGFDSTAGIQAAVDTGFDLIFPGGEYHCAGITLNNNQQRFLSLGEVRLKKNANGTIISGSGNDLTFSGIVFDGEGGTYTGDNIDLSGDRITFDSNCGSQDTPGLALKCTGNQIVVYGGAHKWATTATGASAFDIEIGVSGTATLYHYLSGIRTNTTTGGIKLIDTGSHTLIGCQFGKLSILSGTSPSGVNGGNTMGCRIHDDITVELSLATFVGNAPSSSGSDLTFAAGTSGCRWDSSNTSLNSVTNNGNANNFIFQDVSTGGTVDLAFGDDTNQNMVELNTYSVGDWKFSNNIILQNNKTLRIEDSGGTPKNILSLSTGNDVYLGIADAGNFLSLNGGDGGVYLAISGVSEFQAYNGYFRPVGDGADNLGGASNRWATVYATTGTINTSDLREKIEIRLLELAERRVGQRCKELIRAYRWKDTGTYGDKINFGVVAQDVIAAFEAEGLDALDYDVVVHDQWSAQPAIVRDGVEVEPARKAGDRYGVRYDQLLAMIVSAI